MMLKRKLTCLIAALFLASPAFSTPLSLCPDIKDIKAEGLDLVELIPYGINLYFSYRISNYNTDNSWTFVIAPLVGDSEDDILKQANSVLRGIHSQGVPEQHGRDINCEYDTGNPDIGAVAATTQLGSPLRLKYLFKVKEL